jgi:CheY-specific phosphatase CheX
MLMFSQYFGHYLLNRDLITREQLADALVFQQSVHVKFGVIAVDEGYMTPSQVEEVHEKQRQVDKRFGEIAIDLGYLTSEQVDSLVSSQKQNHLYLAQALVDRGYMTIEQFGNALNEYKKENSLSDDQFDAIKSGSIESLVETILVSKDDETKAYAKYLSLFVKNMIRFIDDQVYIELAEKDANTQGAWLVYQEIVGQSPLYTGMSLNEDVFLKIASVYAEEELTVVDELAMASVSEFLNLHNGIYLVNMSNWGVELNMKPQEIAANASVSGESFIVKVNTSKGSFHLILSNHPENVTIVSHSENQQTV